MKTTIKTLVVALFCSIPFLVASQIIGITETTRGNSLEIHPQGKQIIDINSRLALTLSKEKLITAIESQFPQFAKPLQLNRQIENLAQALTDQEFILTTLDNQVQSIKTQDQFFSLMDDFLALVQSNEMLASRYEVLSGAYFNSAAISEEMSMEAYIFDNLGSDLSMLQNELAQVEGDKYTISLVAFKRDKQGGDRVHIENFDSYIEREYVTIPRWVTTLSEDQRQQLQELARKADENSEKTRSIFERLKGFFMTNFPSAECFKTQFGAIKAFVNDPEVATQLSQTLKSTATKLTNELEAYLVVFDLFKINVGEWNISSPFEIGDQFGQLVTTLPTLRIDIETFESELASVTALASRTQTLVAGTQGCIQVLEIDLKKLEQSWLMMVNQQKRYVQNKALGKEVMKFSLDDLPEKGYINLKGTGSRANGDELLIELFLRETEEDSNTLEKSHRLEQRSLVMQLIGARSEVAVGMIMANPGESSVDFDLEHKFYFAPSASLLLKFGSRKSYFYNEFIDLGVGLNFASPDFNTDGAPEFGTGIIVTAFKNILSVGYNYNVTLDAPYWFFGVNLPFNLPGLPVNTVR